MQAIKTYQLSKTFHQNVALNLLDLEFEQGKFYYIFGANGAGKSTLINLLQRQLLPSSGYAEVLGINSLDDDASVNEHVAYISESLNYDLPYSLAKFASIQQKLYQSWHQQIFTQVCEDLQLNLELNLSQVSRGQRIRYFFALAAARQPKIYLLDEISAVLDIQAREYVQQYLELQVAQGATVLFATNIIDDMDQSDRAVIFLNEGCLYASTTLAEFRRNHTKIRSFEKFNKTGVVHVGKNTDTSLSYIIESSLLENIDLEYMADHRMITMNEMFAYHIKKLNDKEQA